MGGLDGSSLPAAPGASPRHKTSISAMSHDGAPRDTAQELKMVFLSFSCKNQDNGFRVSGSSTFLFPIHLTKQFHLQLNWYKLANEAAMKAALIKQQRFKDVPRYNPAAERVRQRATWLEQVRDACRIPRFCDAYES
jgi:hypothetical protein